MSKKRGVEEKPNDIPLPSVDTVICGVIRHLGGDHVLTKCLDGVDRKVRIPGKIRKKVWINEGDIVLVGVWDFNPTRGDIVHKYERGEISKLLEKGVISKDFLDAISGLI